MLQIREVLGIRKRGGDVLKCKSLLVVQACR